LQQLFSEQLNSSTGKLLDAIAKKGLERLNKAFRARDAACRRIVEDRTLVRRDDATQPWKLFSGALSRRAP
jgi:hypothetical protein